MQTFVLCTTCGGSGRMADAIERVRDRPLSERERTPFMAAASCPDCAGAGRTQPSEPQE